MIENLQPTTPLAKPDRPLRVVLSGTYRRGTALLREEYEMLRDHRLEILSPGNMDVQSEQDGFVYMRGETTQTPEALEARHLDAIRAADFIWLHSPDGYIGPSTALEAGFAQANGIPVFARSQPRDQVMRSFVTVVPNIRAALASLHASDPRPPLVLPAFQEYYRRVATQRGYERESAQDCLLLMMEEVGELARALRKRSGLARHHAHPASSEAAELADVFLYVVHLANIFGLNLAEAVAHKEKLNHERFLNR